MTKHILSIDGGGIRGILPLALQWALPRGSVMRCDTALGPNVNTAFDDASPANVAALVALGRQFVTAEINNAVAMLPPPVA